MSSSRRGTPRLGVLGVAMLAAAAFAAPAQAQDPEPVSVVEVEVANQAELDRLVATASDVTSQIDYRGDSKFVQIVTTESEQQLLRAQGFEFGRVVDTEAQMEARKRANDRQLRSIAAFDGILQNVAEGEHVKILRADYFTNRDTQKFLSVEAKSDQGEDDVITVLVGQRSRHADRLRRLRDARRLRRRGQVPLPPRHRSRSPATVPARCGSTPASRARSSTARRKDWAPPTDETGNPELVDFLDGYIDPTQAVRPHQATRGGSSEHRRDHRAAVPDQRLPPQVDGAVRRRVRPDRRAGLGRGRRVQELRLRGRRQRPRDAAQPGHAELAAVGRRSTATRSS